MIHSLKVISVVCLIMGMSSTALAGYYPEVRQGTLHGHNSYRSYYGPGYYGPGYYGRGYWGGGPNIIINVPAQPYYQPQCENVQVCNPYNECWLERFCN